MPQSAQVLLTSFDGPGAGMDLWNAIIAFGIFFTVLYFVALRPQQQEKKAHEDMLAALAKDDQVVLTGGIHAKVVEIQADTLIVEIADRTRIKVDRAAVSRKIVPATAAAPAAAPAKK